MDQCTTDKVQSRSFCLYFCFHNDFFERNDYQGIHYAYHNRLKHHCHDGPHFLLYAENFLHINQSMDELKVYTNKNIGSFLSIPASKIAKTNNLEDSIYFSRHLNKLRNKSIDELRGTKHYKSKTQQYAKSLEGIDTTSLKDMSTKLKLNIKMYNPLAKTDTKYKEGGSVRKSYKTIELLQVSKNSFKPMLFLGGTPNAAARSFIGFQQPRKYPGRQAALKTPPLRNIHTPSPKNIPNFNSDYDISMVESLMNDFNKVLKSIEAKGDVNEMISDFISNPIYKELRTMWSPSNLIFEDTEELGKQNGGDANSQQLISLLENPLMSSFMTFLARTPTAMKRTFDRVASVAIPGLKFVLVNIPNKLFEGINTFEKKMYVVILTKETNGKINPDNSAIVGSLISKKSITEIKSINPLSIKLVKPFTYLSGGPQKWAFRMGEQMTKMTPAEFEKLKSPKNEGRDRLIEDLTSRFKDDELMVYFLEQINSDELNAELWQGLEEHVRRSKYITEDYLSRKKKLFYSLYYLILVCVIYYMFFLNRREYLQNQFKQYGEAGVTIFNQAFIDPIPGWNVKANLIKQIIYHFLTIIQDFEPLYPITQELIKTIPEPAAGIVEYVRKNTAGQILNYFRDNGIQTELVQEMIYTECIRDIANYRKTVPDYSSPFFGNATALAETELKMVSTYLKCEVWLTEDYLQKVNNYVRNKQAQQYYGIGTLASVANTISGSDGTKTFESFVRGFINNKNKIRNDLVFDRLSTDSLDSYLT